MIASTKIAKGYDDDDEDDDDDDDDDAMLAAMITMNNSNHSRVRPGNGPWTHYKRIEAIFKWTQEEERSWKRWESMERWD